MKIVFFALLIAACFAGLTTKAHDGQVKFNMDLHEGSPFGLVLEGLIDPKVATNNKIQAFIKLANQYIPVLESLAVKNNELKLAYDWQIRFAGVSIDVHWFVQLIIGWRVAPGSSSANFYEVTYTPFIWGGTFTRVNGTTWPAVGSTRVGLTYASAYAPVAFTLYREGRICFSARYTIEPVHLQTQLFAALNECSAEIIDEVINQQPIHLNCNYTNPVNVTLFNVNFTDFFVGDIIGETCIGF